MPLSRHTFAGANTDDDAGSKPAGAFDAALNIALESGAIAPVRGNVLVPGYALPTGTNKVLGALVDGANGTLVEALYNSNGTHRLVRYDPAGNSGAGSRTTLLEWAGLNFSADLVLKEGVNGFIIDGLLAYRDAAGELRCLSLARAATGTYYTTAYLAAEPFALHLTKVPPTYVLAVSRVLGSTGAPGESLRLIQNKPFQFSYRYRYIDGEVTVLAPYSPWLDVLGAPGVASFNTLAAQLPASIPAGVLEIEVLVRETTDLIWQVADTLRRDNSGNFPAIFNFYGQITGSAILDAEAIRPHESLWPCEVGPVLARNRPHSAVFLEGYPTPEPAFTAEVISTPSYQSETADVYQVDVQMSDNSHVFYFYQLATGTYGDASSTYYQVVRFVLPGSTVYISNKSILFSYAAAFTTPVPNEANPQNRTTTTLTARTVQFLAPVPQTLHEDTTYRVVVQFYDALGRPYGCSLPRTVRVPVQVRAAGNTGTFLRSLRVTLTTTGAVALNNEIPQGAYSYAVLVAPNDRTGDFRQILAADVLAYIAHVRDIQADGTVKETDNLQPAPTAHEKLWVDIGNAPAVGLGYVFEPGSGDTLCFLEEPGRPTFPITKQQGDYLEIQWQGYPSNVGPAKGRLVEIYSPKAAPGPTYYERGPRLPIVRTGNNRSYGQAVVDILGDCFLFDLTFPVINYPQSNPASVYQPPDKKQFISDPAGGTIVVESMVSRRRLIPSSTTIVARVNGTGPQALVDAYGPNGVVFGSGAGPLAGLTADQVLASGGGGTTTTADNAARDAATLLWLDMSYGGRVGVRIPLALQQVRRNIERYGGQKQTGNLINGLSRWEALNQYDELPQEQGYVTALVLADPTQTGGSVLVALQQHGNDSLYLNQQPAQIGNAQQLLITSKVIGGDNALKGHYGCVDPASIAPTGDGSFFYWCREKQEAVRYNKGTVPLGETYKFRRRLQALARQYANAPVRGCYDPRRQEYLLTFGTINNADLPGVTVAWSERREAWADAIAYLPEAGQGVGNELVSYVAGQAYRHTPAAPVGTFAGVYTAPWVRFTCASPDEAAKRWMTAEQRTEGNLWSLQAANSLATDTGQVSRSLDAEWARQDGVYRLRGFRRDENTAGIANAAQARDNGTPLLSPRLTLTFTCPALNPQPLSLVVVSWQARPGQNMGS